MCARRQNQPSSSDALGTILLAMLVVAVLAVLLFLCGCSFDLYADPYAVGDPDFGPLLPTSPR